MFYSPVNDSQMAFSQNNSMSLSPRSSAQCCDSGGQPVRVAIVNSQQSNCDSSAPSESNGTNNYYRRPTYDNDDNKTQLDADSDSSHLSFLYDRAQKYSPEVTATAGCQQQQQQQNTNCSVGRGGQSCVSPPGEYYGAVRPVAVQSQSPVLNGVKSPCFSPDPCSPATNTEYNPFNRATPAPMQQNAPRLSTTGNNQQQFTADNQHRQTTFQTRPAADSLLSPQLSGNGARPQIQLPVNRVEQQMSQLGLSNNQQQPPTTVHTPRSRPTQNNNNNNNQDRTRTLPNNFTRRQSAPGPVGATGQAGSRKPWSYTPTFGVNNTGRTGPGPVSMARPVVHASADFNSNGFYRPQTLNKPSEGPKFVLNSDSDSESKNFNADGSEVDRSSIRYNLREGDEVGDYEQTSIRYTGKVNPSKTFRMLQTVTGSDDELDVRLTQATARRQARRRQPSRDELEDQLPNPDADDIVDISYVGANIPSRTFRILQEAIGERGSPVEGLSTDDVTDETGFGLSGRNVRVVHLRPMKKHSSLDNILSYTDL